MLPLQAEVSPMKGRDIPYETHDEVMEKLLRDPEFRCAYDELQPEYALKEAVIRARVEDGLTQAELAERMGMKQSAVARIETGAFNPTLTTLRKLAAALGVSFEIGAGGVKVIGSKQEPRAQRSRNHQKLKRTA